MTLACQPLEELGAITSAYAQAIIRETEQLGPWYILSPEFALPHARPEEGVISSETHLSLLCLKEAVPFPRASRCAVNYCLGGCQQHPTY